MTLKYPLELNETDVDYVIFQAHEYRTNKKMVGQQAGRTGGGLGPAKGQPIVLYMPNSTPAMGNGNSWKAKSFEGPAGQLGIGIVNSAAGGIMNAPSVVSTGDGQGAIDAIVQNARSNFENIKNRGGPAIQQGLISAMGGLMGLTGSNVLQLQRGEIYNPNIELLYESPNLREFGFAFNFIPKNALEAQRANDIIMEFKKWSAPSKSGQHMLRVPCVWVVKYMAGASQNPNMNAFKRSVLKQVSVQANPTSNMHQSFEDGMPIVTSLTLGFQEVDIILREDHANSGSNQGY